MGIRRLIQVYAASLLLLAAAVPACADFDAFAAAFPESDIEVWMCAGS